MKHAKEIQRASPKKRWRIVTMQGELVEASGIMIGGGKPQKGLLLLNDQQHARQQDETTQQLIDQLSQQETTLRTKLGEAKDAYDTIQQKYTEW
eukprot:CAMPEP_0117433070 /NCGR_PEP_ID=MMETSP0758-20121206/12484_1 /TAXON_ID=63605 /ORGANISM="Percolomonas cosmopolitus, Strain AE-1 (ATCC 50343)" /LENGTH=93 /DNA_ID=CAMNT_0005223471 /DNA_START=811 /DNA_END=1089 /DNA_ORIENTATION=-